MNQSVSCRAARCAAGIVIYHPDFEALSRLVASVAADAVIIGIYANSPVSAEQQLALEKAAAPCEIVVLRPGFNRGLGVAYNTLCRMALARGAEFLLLLDQDSIPGPGMIGQLVRTHRRLAAAGESVAAVGPQPVGPDGEPMRLSAVESPDDVSDLRRVGFVISSGSLVRVDVMGAVGDFREDFFIDAIDIEWCMRAVARGFSIWVDPMVPMTHSLGSGIIRLPFGLRIVDQPPPRLYSSIRNQTAMLRLLHVPRGHKVKFALSMPIRIAVYLVRNRFSRDCVRSLVNGLADGLRDRLGPPDSALMSPVRLTLGRGRAAGTATPPSGVQSFAGSPARHRTRHRSWGVRTRSARDAQPASRPR